MQVNQSQGGTEEATTNPHKVGDTVTLMDLFTPKQFIVFHGQQPPTDWTAASAEDVHRAALAVAQQEAGV